MTILAGLIAIALVVIILAIPVTWLSMLFLGNIGHNIGFWALFPGIIAAKAIFSSSTSHKK